MEPVSEEVRHHGSAVRPVQAEPSGVQAREAQYLRPARREGGTAQVGIVAILLARKERKFYTEAKYGLFHSSIFCDQYSVRCYLPMLDTGHIQTRIRVDPCH